MSRGKDFPHFQAAFRALGLSWQWAVEPLSGYEELVRVKLFSPVPPYYWHELTCLQSELPAALDWAHRTAASEAKPALIVAEHWQPPWTTHYRWTSSAWQRARELDAQRRAS